MADRVLVPLDGSPSAFRALDVAIAQWRPTEVVVVHVIDLSEASHGVEGGIPDGWYEAKEEVAQDILERANERLHDEDIKVITVVETGRPARTILTVAEERSVDHIVMGSHGRSGLARVLLGSVAETVLRRADVPVTIVRGNEQ